MESGACPHLKNIKGKLFKLISILIILRFLNKINPISAKTMNTEKGDPSWIQETNNERHFTSCTLCSKAFIDLSELEKHLEQLHNVVDSDVIQQLRVQGIRGIAKIFRGGVKTPP